MKKILIITDSLAMPRGGVSYEDTWPYLLQKNHNNILLIDKTQRASTSDRLVNEGGGYKNVQKGADLLEHYSPDVVIIQLGITDCSPRYFRRVSLLNLIIRFSPNKTKSFLYKCIKKFWKRKLKYSFVSPENFKYNFNNYIKRANNICEKIIIIGILPPTKSFIYKSPEIKSSIKLYNKILQEFDKVYDKVSFIEPISENVVENFTIDELHINSNGNKLTYNEITKILKL